MKQSKMTRWEPRMKNGVHESFTGQHGVLYKFDVEFDNGDIGEANSPNQTPKWVVGKEYTYTLESNQYGNKIKGMKMVPDAGAAAPNANAGGYQKSPEEQKRISMQVSYEIATRLTTDNIEGMSEEEEKNFISKYPSALLKQGIEAHANEFCEWIMKVPEHSIIRSNAIRRAVEQRSIPQFEITSKTKIMERAEEIYQFYLKA